MNFANLPVFILFFSAVYLVGIYSLLTVAQIFVPSNNPLAQNPEENSNRVKIP